MEEEECRVPAGSILYVWGYNRSGQAGRAAYTRVRQPSKVDVNSSLRVTSISCGLEHTAAVASDGSMFTWGANEFGQLGDGSENNSDRPARVKALRNELVKSVACGAYCTAAIADSKDNSARGRLWVWGQNQTSNHPRIFWGAFSPKTVVVQVSCGRSHIAAVSSEGLLQTWGYNECGQLGRGFRCEGLQRASLVPSFSKFLDEPPEFVRVEQVACGDYHTAAVSDTGDVYTWGYGSAGQLGHRTLRWYNREVLPRRVVTLEGVRVTQISAGGGHTCAISNDGALFMWGQSVAGQLGLGSPHNLGEFYQKIPVLVINSGVKSVTCGHSHTLVVANDGRLLGCGYNVYGQADSGKDCYTWFPSPIDWCVGEVKCLAAGGGHSAVLTHATTLKELCELKLVECVTSQSVSSIAEVAERLSANSLARFCEKFRENV